MFFLQNTQNNCLCGYIGNSLDDKEPSRRRLVEGVYVYSNATIHRSSLGTSTPDQETKNGCEKK